MCASGAWAPDSRLSPHSKMPGASSGRAIEGQQGRLRGCGGAARPLSAPAAPLLALQLDQATGWN